MQHEPGRIKAVTLGERFQKYLVIKSHYGLTNCKSDEVAYTSLHCCNKTMDGQMAISQECFFELDKIMGNKVTFVSFRERSPQSLVTKWDV